MRPEQRLFMQMRNINQKNQHPHPHPVSSPTCLPHTCAYACHMGRCAATHVCCSLKWTLTVLPSLIAIDADMKCKWLKPQTPIIVRDRGRPLPSSGWGRLSSFGLNSYNLKKKKKKRREEKRRVWWKKMSTVSDTTDLYITIKEGAEGFNGKEGAIHFLCPDWSYLSSRHDLSSCVSPTFGAKRTGLVLLIGNSPAAISNY